MKNQTDKTVVSEQSPNKPRRSKSREVTSRFLSPTSEPGISSPNQTLSPVRQRKTTGLFTDSARKHRSVDEIGLIKGLWPSSSSSSSSSSTSQSSSKKFDTLADHLGNERLKDLMERKNEEKASNNASHSNQFLSRQRSSSEFSRFEKEKDSSKENHRPIIGGSMRHTGKFRFSGMTVSSSNKSSSSSSNLVPGRFSVDENALNLNRRSSRRNSEFFIDILSSGSESSEILSGSTDFSSPVIGKNNNSSFSSSNLTSNNSFLNSTASSRTPGIEVSSRYLNDQSSRLRRGSSDSHIQTPVTSENSLNSNSLTQKSAIKRANSMTGYGSATSQWALSPGRSLVSSPVSVEIHKGNLIGNFSNLRPPNSPSKSKGVGNFLSLGLDMFKSKKSSSSTLSPLGHGIGENAHQLRLLHNQLIQWRYVNARADAVNVIKMAKGESNLLNAWASLSNLQSSVAQKRIQFEKEKLQLKLNTILHSQVKQLEAWGDMERQHLLAVSMTKDCLHSVVCRVPLIEGAKVDPQLVSIALRHSTDLSASIKTMLLDFSPAAQKTASLLSEVAEVVARERLLLEECFELLGLVSDLEIQERSLKCNIVQLKLQQQNLHKKQQQEGMIASK
ncbi:Protein of unknown function DUF566 [Macleaya cordata]|uniref:QWRF family n=1 Tax=Macleaya cordata TaxID=56857 RepID=A0A200QTU2_MACCD|nr:Protein of unknown function DUF566 [Macleaya cordata]